MSNVPDFDLIKHLDDHGTEYWSARELAPLLGYKQWRRFEDAIQRAKTSCENAGNNADEHFAGVGKTSAMPRGGTKPLKDYALSRFACYLIAQNGDPRKTEIAAAQAYFAIQTRRQQLADELAEGLPENEDGRRIKLRGRMRSLNSQLKDAAKKSGAKQPKDYALFFNHGYMGLYGGETEDDIHARKNLKPQEKILDYMGSDELVYNAFRATLTKQKLEREQPTQMWQANSAHREMGEAVRKTIIETGATLPEHLPTPTKSIQQLEKEDQKRILIQQQPQLPGFEKDLNSCES